MVNPTTSTQSRIVVHEDAYALQCIRADHKNNQFIYYTAIRFPGRERDGIDTAIRRCLGGVTTDPKIGDYAVLSIINKDEDEVQELYLTRPAFKYLQRTLKFRVIPEESFWEVQA
jgi:hypothetical protein